MSLFDVSFSDNYVTFPLLFFMGSTLYVFLPDVYLVTRGWIFDISIKYQVLSNFRGPPGLVRVLYCIKYYNLVGITQILIKIGDEVSTCL